MKQFKVLILDDEEPARLLLSEYCKKMDGIEVVALVGNALEAKFVIESQPVDILLSDIQMDDLTGIDLVKMLKQKPITIFTTAYSEYALESYDLDVVDYLVKPISFQRFYQALEKAKELMYFTNNVSTGAENEAQTEYIFVRTNRKMVKLNFRDILFTESYGEYVKIHTKDDMVLALQTTNFMETALPKKDFVRIHRSYIVNLEHIREIEGNLVTIDTHKLTISKRMKDAFMMIIKQKGIL